MIDKSEHLAKSSAKKFIPLGSHFDHRSLMLQFRTLDTNHQLDLGGISLGKTRTVSG
jgi:hypothetical protein